MEFIAELNESRMFKRLKQLTGRNMSDVAERLFEHLLALQIFANEDRGTAQKYASQIMRMQHFDGFRTSQSDLYNLITLILNPTQYSHIFSDDTKYTIPELRMRRNLRALERGNFNNDDFSQMMLILQREFDSLPAYLLTLRRQISNWAKLSDKEKSDVAQRLLYQMRERGMQSDFYILLQRLQKNL